MTGSQQDLFCASGCTTDMLCANADLGQYVASSVSRPTAQVDAHPRQGCNPRGVHSNKCRRQLQCAADHLVR